jgi:hypothetical protein
MFYKEIDSISERAEVGCTASHMYTHKQPSFVPSLLLTAVTHPRTSPQDRSYHGVYHQGWKLHCSLYSSSVSCLEFIAGLSQTGGIKYLTILNRTLFKSSKRQRPSLLWKKINTLCNTYKNYWWSPKPEITFLEWKDDVETLVLTPW